MEDQDRTTDGKAVERSDVSLPPPDGEDGNDPRENGVLDAPRRMAGEGPFAPLRAGAFTIGQIDEVNGPSSQEVVVAISKHEAERIVRHWYERVVRITERWRLFPQVSSSEARERPYACSRVDAMIRAGLLDPDEADSILDMILKEQNLPPFDDAPAWELLRQDLNQTAAADVNAPPTLKHHSDAPVGDAPPGGAVHAGLPTPTTSGSSTDLFGSPKRARNSPSR